jgi:hypothetical protein
MHSSGTEASVTPRHKEQAMTRKSKATKVSETPIVHLPSFAKKVLEVARYLPERYWFGPNKVYICKVWEVGFSNYISLDVFKELLKQAHIQGLLYLSRADLIQAMNQQWIQESEIKLVPGSDTAVVNFILIV